MLEVKCYFEDGNTIISSINTNFEGAKDYFLNKVFNIGSVTDNMQKCIMVEEV